MVHKHVSRKDPDSESVVSPAYTCRLDMQPIPKFRMPDRADRRSPCTG